MALDRLWSSSASALHGEGTRSSADVVWGPDTSHREEAPSSRCEGSGPQTTSAEDPVLVTHSFISPSTSLASLSFSLRDSRDSSGCAFLVAVELHISILIPKCIASNHICFADLLGYQWCDLQAYHPSISIDAPCTNDSCMYESYENL